MDMPWSWSSLVELSEGSYLPNCQTNLVIAHDALSLLFRIFINTTAYHLGRYRYSHPISCRVPCPGLCCSPTSQQVNKSKLHKIYFYAKPKPKSLIQHQKEEEEYERLEQLFLNLNWSEEKQEKPGTNPIKNFSV